MSCRNNSWIFDFLGFCFKKNGSSQLNVSSNQLFACPLKIIILLQPKQINFISLKCHKKWDGWIKLWRSWKYVLTPNLLYGDVLQFRNPKACSRLGWPRVFFPSSEYSTLKKMSLFSYFFNRFYTKFVHIESKLMVQDYLRTKY